MQSTEQHRKLRRERVAFINNQDGFPQDLFGQRHSGCLAWRTRTEGPTPSVTPPETKIWENVGRQKTAERLHPWSPGGHGGQRKAGLETVEGPRYEKAQGKKWRQLVQNEVRAAVGGEGMRRQGARTRWA